MKNILIGLLLLLSFQIFAQNDFRKMNWGDTVSQLNSNYPDVDWGISSDDNMKSYTTEDYVGGLNVNIHYLFIDNKLIIGAYEFIEEHSSDNLFYEDFISISEFLNQKYDMKRTEKWNDTTWKNNLDFIGFALRMGNVEIEEIYEDEKTSIKHRISSDDSAGIEHLLIYRNMDYVKSQRNTVLDDF